MESTNTEMTFEMPKWMQKDKAPKRQYTTKQEFLAYRASVSINDSVTKFKFQYSNCEEVETVCDENIMLNIQKKYIFPGSRNMIGFSVHVQRILGSILKCKVPMINLQKII